MDQSPERALLEAHKTFLTRYRDEVTKHPATRETFVQLKDDKLEFETSYTSDLGVDITYELDLTREAFNKLVSFAASKGWA